ncbi:MAG TPA: cation diffusion facilitator family transporter [Geminicoccus sp.]|jgi:cation diffusion facilitator family transporter|uniref:cation diffusion facilitator family transporter n=1 Tax=Geminicoccus sp. TaxID=2024832 RepID=UPI002E36415E|nr:cation diffusion facilitator family transporter [Geminicoccus sp.]HEX2527152.1 cation diffusion facilitator family transporter [Geminicoccus sp.]
MDRTLKLALGSIVVGAIVLGLKYFAYHITGSIALYSDALESIINVATAVAAFYAIRLSSIPPDANHPYGHHKAEYISAVLEGALIVLAAVSILREAYGAFIAPRPLEAPFAGLVINGVASLINGAWCFVLFRYGRRWRSPALVADARHLRTDVISSATVIVGVMLVPLTGWLQIDPILAALVAVNVLWSGWKLMRESIGGLMDETAPEDTVARVREVISLHAEGALEAHDLRTRHAGRMTFIDFHLVVPGSMTVSESHALCDRLEEALRNGIEDTVVTIHVEPEEKAKHPGGVPVI